MTDGATCKDTNGDLLDKHLDDCNWYIANSDLCGEYDTSSFNANQMCCSCGGGVRSQVFNQEPAFPNEDSVD